MSQVLQNSITLSLNGESTTHPAPLSVAGLLGRLELDIRKVAVERNEEIVPRSTYGQTWLQNGDRLEIVHFIGGG
jgi:sulfur carrier protein